MKDQDPTKCPNCGEQIARGATLCRHCDRGLDPAQFSACPSCREMVRNEAVLCRFCQSKITRAYIDHEIEAPPPSQPTKEPGGIARFNPLANLFRVPKDTHPLSVPSYGEGVRKQVIEVIVRQALAGAPWREICQGPMLVNGITPEEIEEEIRKRKGLISPVETNEQNSIEDNFVKCEQQIMKMLQISNELNLSQSNRQRTVLAEELKEVAKQLRHAMSFLKQRTSADHETSELLQLKLDGYNTKYDAMLDLLNLKEKEIISLNKKLAEFTDPDID
ncbi:MAG: zinc ribbon domain-containing protein [Candidatus Obscuribacterales bacterium]|nr:zinc ribbon domain-containing protein [Candidatus Obscuribacterales bacterium]